MHYLYGNSDRCQACVRCIEGVRISEGLLWEVPLYYINIGGFNENILKGIDFQ